MKALVYTGPNQLEVRDVPQPVPGADEVLIRVEAVGICGSDMHAYHGHDNRRPPPLILGHEAAGHIALGPRTGERVTINPLVVDPTCPYAIDGRWHLSPTRQIISMPPRAGAFAEFVCIPARNVVAISDTMRIEKAALAEPIAVAWHALRIGTEKLCRPLATCRMAIIGGGAIGLATALVARHFGAKQIVIGEPNDLRRKTIATLEEFSVYQPNNDAPEANSIDLVIDAVGAQATRAAASSMVKPGGVIVHAGLLPGHDGFDIRKITLQEITLTGTYCYTPHDFIQTVEAIEHGWLGPLAWMQERALMDGAAAFADIDNGLAHMPKIVLRC